MPTIHDQIDEVLAAAVHNELTDDERRALHVHLVECAECRALHKEEQLMNKALGEVFTDEKPDFGFEKRMLYAFRHKAPPRASVAVFLVNLMRSRATQLAGAAALLLALFEMGRFLTGEDMSIPFVRESRIASLSSSVKESAPRDQQLGAANATVASTDQAKVSGERGKESDRLGVGNGVAAAPASVVPRSDIASGSTSTTGVHKTAALARFAGERNEENVQQGAREMAVAQSAGEPRAARQLEATGAGDANRKLIRNASVDLEVRSLYEAVQQIA